MTEEQSEVKKTTITSSESVETYIYLEVVGVS